MEKRKPNWSLWAGFLVALIAFVSYFLFFSQLPYFAVSGHCLARSGSLIYKPERLFSFDKELYSKWVRSTTA
jgi:hypothetical protein